MWHNDVIIVSAQIFCNNFLQNFVELNDGVSMESFSKKIAHIVQQKAKDKKEGTLFVQPMEKWHLYGDFKDWVNVGGLIDYVRLFIRDL